MRCGEVSNKHTLNIEPDILRYAWNNVSNRVDVEWVSLEGRYDNRRVLMLQFQQHSYYANMPRMRECLMTLSCLTLTFKAFRWGKGWVSCCTKISWRLKNCNFFSDQLKSLPPPPQAYLIEWNNPFSKNEKGGFIQLAKRKHHRSSSLLSHILCPQSVCNKKKKSQIWALPSSSHTGPSRPQPFFASQAST